ncbi:MAG: hypothetical protein F9K13_02500 [Candidatus Methylomirabilis oxygeniifera]|uniref:Uncharacterized protein n=1 Tax=Methylomirabilis oxygeniifera TaxID=671143 RepID=D5MF16_METO1|nr:MAG: hypothetical protein F9K13_02500 [Candidatus Methylomirabilis oxyfera]CBE68345.1 protein of unknown function [Candidatus Methylomirabilis oxyfera]
MLTFGTQTVEEPIPLACICDRCGKSITPDSFIEWEEKQMIRFTGGYGSVFGDGTQVECDLCQSCMEALIGVFCRRITPVSPEETGRADCRP